MEGAHAEQTTVHAIYRRVKSRKQLMIVYFIFFYRWVYCPLFYFGDFFSFLILYIFGRIPWTGDQLFVRPLPKHRTTQTQNKRTQTSTLQVGFEHTIPAFERAKTFHAFDLEATGIGFILFSGLISSANK
jgi:hypothetical protein